jgi:hypothetical protein
MSTPKSKSSATVRSRLFGLLGRRRQTALLRSRVEHTCSGQHLCLPRDFSSVHKALIVLPEDALSALQHVHGVRALISHFGECSIVLLCEEAVRPYFEGMPGIARVNAYRRDQRYCFSRHFEALSEHLHSEGFDLCVLLERNPDLSLLYLVGQTGAEVRVGYAGAYPFLNMRVQLSPDPAYLPTQNLVIARMLGAPVGRPSRWSVSPRAIDEARHLLHECGLPPQQRLAGIDGYFFVRTFGESWTESLCAAVAAVRPVTWYLYGDSDVRPGLAEAWAARQRIPVFHDMSAAHQAALISMSEVMVTGATPLCELTRLLDRPRIAVLDECDEVLHHEATPQARVARYRERPDAATIVDVQKLLGGIRP